MAPAVHAGTFLETTGGRRGKGASCRVACQPPAHPGEVAVALEPGPTSPARSHPWRAPRAQVSPLRRDLLPGRRPSAQPPRRVLVLVTAVSVHTNGTVFATDTDITFVAVTKETGPLEFTWYFGDDAPVRTTSRSIRRRLAVPGGCVRGRHGSAARAPGGTVLPLRASVSPGASVHRTRTRWEGSGLPPAGGGGGRWDRKAPGQAPRHHQGGRGRFLSQGQVTVPTPPP